MILKLKRTPGLYLVGFMASGKTTIGRALAEQIGWPFADMDLEIEAREGKGIPQIFVERGEAGFRQTEAEVLRRHVRSIEAGQPCVCTEQRCDLMAGLPVRHHSTPFKRR
jgi:shikimate kinase